MLKVGGGECGGSGGVGGELEELLVLILFACTFCFYVISFAICIYLRMKNEIKTSFVSIESG